MLLKEKTTYYPKIRNPIPLRYWSFHISFELTDISCNCKTTKSPCPKI